MNLPLPYRSQPVLAFGGDAAPVCSFTLGIAAGVGVGGGSGSSSAVLAEPWWMVSCHLTSTVNCLEKEIPLANPRGLCQVSGGIRVLNEEPFEV